MIKRLLYSFILFSCLVFAIPLTANASDVLKAVCSSNGDTANSAVCTDANPTTNPVVDKLKNVTLIVAFVAGAAAILLILVGSIQYIISNGDATKVSNAKRTIIYALVGLAVVALSATIIEFVVNKL